MNFKKIIFFLFLIFSIFPFNKINAQNQNVGIIPSNIWYSKDPFQEGDKIKIYTVIYNGDLRELSGTVIFFDDNTLLGKENFSIAGKTNSDVSINWTVVAGDHTIFAKIENAKFLVSAGKYEEVYLSENKTAESKKTIIKKEITELPNNITNKISDVTSSVSGIGKTIKDNTPAVVTKTVDSTISSLEDIRTNIGTSLIDKKENVQKEINALNKIKLNNEEDIPLDQVATKTIKEKLKDSESGSLIQKPFKYVELFFLNTLSFIFNNKIIFYLIIVGVIFLILRFIWRKIF